MAINKTNFYDADYESIKANLKNFLQSNSSLIDFNFEGSAISTWLNLMSYIIFYINTTSNFLVNELFIASATLDTNIYKHAYQLNYLPKRKKSITLPVKVTVLSNPNVPVPLKRFSNFTIKNINFVNLQDYEDLRTVEHITLYQGEVVDTNAIEDVGYPLYYNGDEYETFTVPDKENVDRNYFKIYTINDNQEVQEWTSVFDNKNYFQAHNYFIRYLDSFQIMFDQNDSLFSLPSVGDNVQMVYLRTDGALYNNTDITDSENGLVFNAESLPEDFAYGDYIEFEAEESILSGGANEESLESIAVHAPLFYTTGGRCVTEDDYNSLILTSDLKDIMTDAMVYSGHKDVVDYNENPQRVLTDEYKLDKGYYIWTAFKKNISDIEEDATHHLITYSLPKFVDFESLYNYFDNYRFMQIFGKFRMPNILQIEPNIYFTYKKGTNLKIDKLNDDIQEFLVNNNFIGFKRTVNQTDLVDFLRDNYSYLNYVTVDFKTKVVCFRPFVSLILSSVEDLTTNISFSCNDLTGIVYRIDETINRIVVRLDDASAGHFDDTFIDEYISINSQITDKQIVASPFDKIIIRLNKFTTSINTSIDEKYLVCEPYSDGEESGKIIFKAGTSLEDITILPEDEEVGRIYYEDGYIEINNVFAWDDYNTLDLNVYFADGIYNELRYRKNDISVSYETALDFDDCEFTYDVEQ